MMWATSCVACYMQSTRVGEGNLTLLLALFLYSIRVVIQFVGCVVAQLLLPEGPLLQIAGYVDLYDHIFWS